MRTIVKFIAITLLAVSQFAYSADQILVTNSTNVPSSNIAVLTGAGTEGTNNSAAEHDVQLADGNAPIVNAASIGTELNTQSSEVLPISSAPSIQQNIPVVNAASINAEINAPLLEKQKQEEEKKENDERLTIATSILVIIALLLVIASVLMGVFGKSVFFSDYTDVLVSTVVSLIALIAMVSILWMLEDQSRSGSSHSAMMLIAILCIGVAYAINLKKAMAHNTGVVTALIAWGRLFLPLILLFMLIIAKRHGAKNAVIRQQNESDVAYQMRVEREERNHEARKVQSVIWIGIIMAATTYLYKNLIHQKEWKGFAGYFGKAS